MLRAEVQSEDAPAAVRRLHGCEMVRQRTDGDGSCSMHSLWGVRDHRGLYRMENARTFLRDAYGSCAATFSAKVNDAALVAELQRVLWSDLVKPLAKAVAGVGGGGGVDRPEAHLVWDELCRTDPDVAAQCVDACKREHEEYESFMQKRDEIVTTFSAL